MSQRNPNCRDCQIAEKVFYSLDRVYGVGSEKYKIFTHNGNLISYAKSNFFSYTCEVCLNFINDCIHINEGRYYTLSKHSNVTVVECSIKKRLRLNGIIIMGTDIGVFLMPWAPCTYQKLLLVRGIKVRYIQLGWVHTMYSSGNINGRSSADNLMQSIFTAFGDDENNLYLIDRNGKALEYETLTYTGEEYVAQQTGIRSWKIYANDKIRVKTHGYYENAEILEDRAPIGKHTKPALCALDYDA